MNLFNIEDPVDIFDDPNLFLERYLNIDRNLEITQYCDDLKNQILVELELRICDLKESNNIDVYQENESKLPCAVISKIKEWTKQKEILIKKIEDYENDLIKSVSFKREELCNEIDQLNVFFKFFWNNFSKTDYDDVELKKAKNKTKKYQLMLNNLQLKCMNYVFNNNKIGLDFRNNTSSLCESSLNFNPIGSENQNEIGYLYLNKILELRKLNKIDLLKVLNIKNVQNLEFEIFNNGAFFILRKIKSGSKLYIYDSSLNKTISKIIDITPTGQLRKINNKILISANNAMFYVIDQDLNIHHMQLPDSYSFFGNDRSHLYFRSIKNKCKIFDLNLQELKMTDENKSIIPLVQNKDQEMPFYAENEITEFIKMNSKYYVKLLETNSDLSSYMNVYSENGDLLQSIRSVYSKSYIDKFDFKLDSKCNLVNLLNARLRFFDSAKENLVQNILILKDINLSSDIKYCIDNADKLYFLLQSTIYYE